MNEIITELKQDRHLLYVPERAKVAISGADAQAFLSRLSTNDLSALFKTGFAQTSFVSNKGRLIDHCLLFARSPDEILLLSAHQDGHIIHDLLDKYLFVDDVEIKACYDQPVYFRVSQSDAHEEYAHLMWSSALSDGTPIYIFASLSLPPHARMLSHDEWQALRIVCFMPESGGEIRDDFMPQNVNLDDFISETKGCYVGQEVIAKARTYQRQVKILCGLKVPHDIFSALTPGQKIANREQQKGVITSVAPCYLPGEINALLITSSVDNSSSTSADFHVEVPFLRKSVINR